ncbi:MAG TPA: DUF86 domain-containing protein [Defluviitoga tunisiensis]|jgi:uncharacterized protein YutE (UPF0331/DUF86 family)|nr:DUF86 domain-containing protein [Defluviitoga tunisiensis]HOL87161.1 DUF86 domain-containing protein [Defluviitoga tunisiensis]HPP11035.1 DUF86 domain-containing protein [Defluviitoga tunisiensis]HQD35459.1 DUF86 domain-containing protein [Bacteroidales bacterium]
MQNDIIINKTATIERCIYRINEEYNNDPENLKNYTKQDSIILNIQRACEACIDIAMHIVSTNKLGVPQTTRQVFDILNEANIIDERLADRLKAMVGFRNIAVHDYQALNLSIVQKIIEEHLNDFLEFTKITLKLLD